MVLNQLFSTAGNHNLEYVINDQKLVRRNRPTKCCIFLDELTNISVSFSIWEGRGGRCRNPKNGQQKVNS